MKLKGIYKCALNDLDLVRHVYLPEVPFTRPTVLFYDQNMQVLPWGAAKSVEYYLEQLHSNHSEHELQEVGNQHDIADRLNGYNHAFHYILAMRRFGIRSILEQTKQQCQSVSKNKLLIFNVYLFIYSFLKRLRRKNMVQLVTWRLWYRASRSQPGTVKCTQGSTRIG